MSIPTFPPFPPPDRSGPTPVPTPGRDDFLPPRVAIPSEGCSDRNPRLSRMRPTVRLDGDPSSTWITAAAVGTRNRAEATEELASRGWHALAPDYVVQVEDPATGVSTLVWYASTVIQKPSGGLHPGYRLITRTLPTPVLTLDFDSAHSLITGRDQFIATQMSPLVPGLVDILNVSLDELGAIRIAATDRFSSVSIRSDEIFTDVALGDGVLFVASVNPGDTHLIHHPSVRAFGSLGILGETSVAATPTAVSVDPGGLVLSYDAPRSELYAAVGSIFHVLTPGLEFVRAYDFEGVHQPHIGPISGVGYLEPVNNRVARPFSVQGGILIFEEYTDVSLGDLAPEWPHSLWAYQLITREGGPKLLGAVNSDAMVHNYGTSIGGHTGPEDHHLIFESLPFYTVMDFEPPSGHLGPGRCLCAGVASLRDPFFGAIGFWDVTHLTEIVREDTADRVEAVLTPLAVDAVGSTTVHFDGTDSIGEPSLSFRWRVTNPEGETLDREDGVWIRGRIDGVREAAFSRPGQYRVHMTVSNSTHSDTAIAEVDVLEIP